MTETDTKAYRKFQSSKALKRLMTRYFMTLKYFRLRRPVAWVTSGAPVEIIRSCGFLTVYPENYGAICGASKKGQELCQIAEQADFSIDVCSYARANIGAMMQESIAPIGGMPAPNCIIAASNLCNTLVKWFEVSADYFQVPIFVIDFPFQFDESNDEQEDNYLIEQFNNMIEFLSNISKKKFTMKRYKKILKHSLDGIILWQKIRESGLQKPSPINAPDLFLNLAPIVSMRGEKAAVRYYQKFYDEILQRIKLGQGAIKNERFRLLWDNIAIWFNLFDFFNFFSKQGACFVVSTYTDAWTGTWNLSEDPMKATARLYKSAYLNLSLEKRAAMMIEVVNNYQIDGIVMHSDRSCKPYSLGQVNILNEVTDKTGVPGILIEADMVDQRFYTDAQVKNRLQAFIEILEANADF